MSKVFHALGKKKALAIGAILVIALITLWGVAMADNLEPGQVAAEKSATLNTVNNTYDVNVSITSAPFGGELGPSMDVILVMDVSGSMNYNMSGSQTSNVPLADRRITHAKDAANNFAKILMGEDGSNPAENRIALISYSGSASLKSVFTDSKATINTAINGLSASGGTNIHAGLYEAKRLLSTARPGVTTAVVLLSDGEPTYSISGAYWSDTTNSNGTRGINTAHLDSAYNSFGSSTYGSGSSAYDIHYDRIIMEANKIRSYGAEIYSVGIADSDNDNMLKALGGELTTPYQLDTGREAHNGNHEAGTVYYAGNEWVRNVPAGQAWAERREAGSWGNRYYEYKLSYKLPAPYTNLKFNPTGSYNDYLIAGFDDFQVAYAEECVLASNAEDLHEAFENFAEAITAVATNAVLEDAIPEYFMLDLNSLPQATRDALDYDEDDLIDGQYLPGPVAFSIDLGSIGASENVNYIVKPRPGYYGPGFTNSNTCLTFEPVEGNPFYVDEGGQPLDEASIDILCQERKDLGDVSGQFAGINDLYTNADRNTPFVVNTANSILGNDHTGGTTSLVYVAREQDADETYDPINGGKGGYIKTINAQTVINTQPTYGSVTLNTDGTFTYTYDIDEHGYDADITEDTFTYYLVDAAGNLDTKSDPITVTIKLKDLVNVSIEYREFATTGQPIITGHGYPTSVLKQVGDAVSYAGDLSSPDTVLENGDAAKPWLIHSSDPAAFKGGTNYTVVTGSNVIKLYYDKGYDLSVAVEHYLEIADNPLTFAAAPANTDHLTGYYHQAIAYSSNTYAGYTFDASRTVDENLKIGGQSVFSLDNKTIKLYYTADSLTTVIKHYDVTGKTVNDDGSYTVVEGDKLPAVSDITVTGKIYDTFNPSDEINTNIANYSYVSYFGDGKFTVEGHIIHAYYQKTPAEINVHFREVGVNDVNLRASAKLTGFVGDSYATALDALEAITIPGYTYVTTENASSGETFVTASDAAIIIRYNRIPASVVVEYKDIANIAQGAAAPNLVPAVTLPADGNGRFGDLVTVSTDNLIVGGIHYTYDSTKEHGYDTADGNLNNLYLAQAGGAYIAPTEKVIVWMKTIPATAKVRHLEVGKDLDLHAPDTIEGVIGGPYPAVTDRDITGFTFVDVEDNPGFFQTKDADIIILRYQRIEKTITWKHQIVNGAEIGSPGSSSKPYGSTTTINQLSDSAYRYVGYTVEPYASRSQVTQGTNALTAQHGLNGYDITLWYVAAAEPGEGSIEVVYREVGGDGSDIYTPEHPISVSGASAYSYLESVTEEAKPDPENPDETIIEFVENWVNVPAETYTIPSIIETITGFSLDTEKPITLNSRGGAEKAEGDDISFIDGTQTIIVWYNRDAASVVIRYVYEESDGSYTDLKDSDTINGKYAESYLDDLPSIPSEITFGGIRYEGGVFPHDNPPFDGKYPLDGEDNVILIKYQQVPYVAIPIEYREKDTSNVLTPPDTALTSIEGQRGSNYSLPAAPGITHFTYDSLDDPYNGTYPSLQPGQSPQTIIYWYTRNDYTVSVAYYEGDAEAAIPISGLYTDTDGDEVKNYQESVAYQGSHTVIQQTINGFNAPTAQPGFTVSGITGNTTIKVYYTRRTDCAVKVEYYDITNESSPVKIEDTTFSGGTFGSAYTTAAGFSAALTRDFGHYIRLDDRTENAGGTFATTPGLVKVFYKKVTVNMLLDFYEMDGDGQPIGDPLQESYGFSGYHGYPYSLGIYANPGAGEFNVNWAITGFTRVIPAELPWAGTFTEDGRLIALYTRINCSVPLEFRELDTETVLQDAVHLTGPYQTSYEEDLEDGLDTFNVAGYEFVSLEDDNVGEDGQKLYDLDMTTMIAWYQKKAVEVTVYYKRWGTDTEIKDPTLIEGVYGDEYEVDTSNFGRYRFRSLENPNNENLASGTLTNDMEDIIVWFNRIGGGGDPDPDPRDPDPEPEPEDPEPQDPEVEEEEEDVPQGPGIPEPQPEEEVIDVPEEEVPQAGIPAAGGTITYLMALMGLIGIALGGLLLRQVIRQK